ncbi:hypothetical protein [Treponema vincentii]|uniref:hypothetical protein n=1 Tax=Treponema vincentii TaxID=69710 RepID=UPI0020A4FA54|nr:hypothetical protein [Treponema vincentii]UTC47958.1 hypothetical protein E4N73_03480 [Treponema vincentii]
MCIKHRIPIYFLLLCALLPINSGCKNLHTAETTNKHGKPSVRAVIQSDKNEESIIKVFVENSDGNAVTAASVICIDKNNRAYSLEFDAAKYYYWVQAVLPDKGDIGIRVHTNAAADILTLTVPHYKLAQDPSITAFQDDAGQSVLKGEALSSQKAIQIAWEPLGEECVYTVEIKTAFSTVYSVASTAAQLVIPANALAMHKQYRLVITAQRIAGDPLLEKFPYYSVSSRRTEGLQFETE